MDPYSSNLTNHRLMEFLVKDPGSYCGYCNSKNGFISYGLWILCLRPSDYENLINKGWRRSGHYIYKPAKNETCCATYPIRCYVDRFSLSKHQRKLLNRIKKEFVATSNIQLEGPKGDVKVINPTNQAMDTSSFLKGSFESYQKSCPKHNVIQQVDLSKSLDNLQLIQTGRKLFRCNSDSLLKQNLFSSQNVNSLASQYFKKYLYLKKASKRNRIQRKIESIATKAETESLGIENLFYDYFQRFLKRKNKTRALKFDELLNTIDIKITLISNTNIINDHEKLMEEYNLYRIYQLSVHKDKDEQLSPGSFVEFLINSPISSAVSPYGTFHTHYRFHDVLIGVGVIDILPQCISSVYFFYDPKYSQFSLGTFSMLCEIARVRNLNKQYPGMQYHYSGFYIYSCSKMSYKSNFRPASLCCPVTYNWVPFHTCRSSLVGQQLCVQLDQAEPTQNKNDNDSNEVSELMEVLGSELCDNFKIAF